MITDLVAELTQVEREVIQPNSRFIDFGIDSVRATELLARLEEAYGLSIPDDDLPDLADLKTLQDVAGYVERHLKNG